MINEAERSPERGWMSASDLKFVIFRDMKDGYRWRLSSPSGETVEYSERGHDHKGECEQDVSPQRESLPSCEGARRDHRVNGT